MMGIGMQPKPRNIMARPKLDARRGRPRKSTATTAIRLTYTPPIRPAIQQHVMNEWQEIQGHYGHQAHVHASRPEIQQHVMNGFQEIHGLHGLRSDL